MKSSIKMPSPAMLVALVALFVSLGGSAYAVSKVGTKQIKNGAVTAPKLKNKAVTAAKISDGAVLGAKIGNGAVSREKIAPGAVDALGLADLSVGTDKLQAGSVTTGKLSNEAVTEDKIAEEAIGRIQIAPGAIGGMVEYTAESLVDGYNSEITVPPNGEFGSGAVSCPDGKTMIFASWRPLTTIVDPPVVMTDMDQFEPPHTFRLEFFNSSATEQRLGLWGLCI